MRRASGCAATRMGLNRIGKKSRRPPPPRRVAS